MILKVKNLLERFTKKNYKKNQKEFRVEKLIKGKHAINYMFNRKATVVILTVGVIKKDIIWMSEYFPEP